MVKQFLLFLASTTSLWTHKAPLVFAPECDRLQSHLANACCGNRFLFMTNMTGGHVRDDLRFLFQLTLPILWTTGKPVIQVDTTCSQQLSYQDKLCLHGGHDKVVQDLNLIRGFLQGGMGDITHYQDWTVRSDHHHKKLLKKMTEHISFMEALRHKTQHDPTKIDDYYIGHPVKFMPYEEQMTRNDSISGKIYACSSHFLWVEQEETSPVLLDYIRSVENPIGLCVSETFRHSQLVNTIKSINPNNTHGKITLLVRKMSKISLSELIDCIQKEKLHIVWCCGVEEDTKFLINFLRVHQKKKTNVGGLFLRNHKDALDVLRILSRHWKKKPSTRTPSWNRFSL